MEASMYDALSTDYDHFVNWRNRLAIELPLILEKLHEKDARQVLDTATGTGMHAIALAQLGFIAWGADISPAMIERARFNAMSAGVSTRFEVAGFGNLAATFGRHTFDALLCLGNSLPHLLSYSELDNALLDFAACLKPGGMLLIQNRNFDAVISNRDRWMEPQSYREGDTELIFQRFYDFNPDGLLTFNMITLKRNIDGSWNQQVVNSRLRPILKAVLMDSLTTAGFTSLNPYGDMSAAPFDAQKSSNLVVLAYRK
jgi:glycine/sarcosine N-methyltransferase